MPLYGLQKATVLSIISGSSVRLLQFGLLLRRTVMKTDSLCFTSTIDTEFIFRGLNCKRAKCFQESLQVTFLY